MSFRGVNKVILVGTMGNDPDVRYTAAGAAIANISLATNDSWQDKQTGEWQERTEWHRVVFFGRQAEVVKQYLHKGSKIYVEGRIQTRKWQDQNTGQDRYTTEIVAFQMQMLGGDAGYGAQPSGGYDAPQQQSGGYGAPQPPQSGGYGAPPPPPQSGGYGAPPPMNQGAGQQIPPAPPSSDGMGQPIPPSPPPMDNVTQPNPPPATDSTKPPADKSFDEDVPF